MLEFIGMESLVYCSLIGAVVIVTGFYAVMWGKVKKEEEKSWEDNGLGSSISSREKVPLLQKSGKVYGFFCIISKSL